MKRYFVFMCKLTAFFIFSSGGVKPVSAVPYLNPVPCPGPVVEVKMLNGQPALFFDGKPDAGIMTNPTAEWGTGIFPIVQDGALTITNKPGYYAYRSVTTTNSFSGAYSVEATITVKEVTREKDGGATLSIRDSKSNSYRISLSDGKDGRSATLWKEETGLKDGYRKWFTIPFAWENGKVYRIKIAFDGKEVSGFIDGQLIGKQTDDKPLTSGKVDLSVYHNISVFDQILVAKPDNTVLFQDDFSEPRPWDWSGQPLQKAKTFSEASVHIYTAVGWGGTDKWSECWLGPGQYDFSKIDRDFEGLIKSDPQALIFPRIYLNAPEWWLKTYPEEASILFAEGGWSSPDKFPSFTSQLWLKDVGEFLRQYIRHINSSSYSNHFIGFVIGGGHALEWVYNWGPYFHDYSPNQVCAFAGWLKTIYPDVVALREAWKDPNITFETVQIPTIKDRMKGDYQNFYNPAQGRKVSDYLRFHAIAVSDAIIYFSRIAKEETENKKLILNFYGYHTASGHQDLARILDCPYVDALGSPLAYTIRQPGGVAVSGIPIDSVQLHKKLFFVEDDIRTHLAPKIPLNDSEGRAQNLEQTIDVIERDFASILSKGINFWYMDWGNGWYNDDAIMSTIEQIQGLATESLAKNRVKTSEIAVIVDEKSMDYQAAKPKLLSVVMSNQVSEQLTRIGTPFDVYLLSDLAKLPEYKMYVFLDTFYLTDKDRTIIKEKVLNRNHTVLWMYAPGYVTDKELSPEAISEITGIKLAVKDTSGEFAATLSNPNHAITKGLDPKLSWKTSAGPFGPLFYSIDPDAQTLAVLTGGAGGEESGKPELAIKEMAGWRSIWCGVPEIPAVLLRQIARKGGVHIYTDSDDVVYANNFMVSVHTRTAGKRTISLPGQFSVTDAFTGRKIVGKVKEFEVNLNQYETGFWLLEK